MGEQNQKRISRKSNPDPSSKHPRKHAKQGVPGVFYAHDEPRQGLSIIHEKAGCILMGNPQQYMENDIPKSNVATIEKLAYSADEACTVLGIGRTSLWRLERRGLIRSIPHLRHKLYPVESLKRFVNGGGSRG